MSKVAVVFWSGTGNTEAMAAAVAQGVKDGGGEAVVKTAAEFTAAELDQFDAVAFGCPSMALRNWRRRSSRPCLNGAARASGASVWGFSAPTAGATVSGCATGKNRSAPTAPIWCLTASSATKPPTRRPWPPANYWAGHWHRNTIPTANWTGRTAAFAVRPVF